MSENFEGEINVKDEEGDMKEEEKEDCKNCKGTKCHLDEALKENEALKQQIHIIYDKFNSMIQNKVEFNANLLRLANFF